MSKQMFGRAFFRTCFKIWGRGLLDLVFPNVCLSCGEEIVPGPHQLCSFCLDYRFEDANPDNTLCSAGTILPEGVLAQQALWNYYKGGDLQHIIHQLKYERMKHVGVDLGRKLGRRIRQHPVLAKKLEEKAIILPVPLHSSKYRIRGFNQAYAIARGFQNEWPAIPICRKEAVVRIKKTRTQTGFSLGQRLDNIKGAFEVKEPALFASKIIIVIDDVFTTGSTTYELAQVLRKAGSGGVIILTIAQA